MASPTINSARCVVVNLDTAADYYDKTADTVDFVASCMKLMTAYTLMVRFGTKTAMEAEDVTITAADVAPTGGTGANLQAGDVWSLWDLLLDVMFPSSNHACWAIARYVGDVLYADAGNTGTQGVTRFVEQMNAHATSLSMSSTTYTSPEGLDTGNTTTANDMARLARGADTTVLSNPDLLAAMRYHTVTVSYDRSGPQTLEVFKGDTGETCPGYLMSKQGIGGGTHLWVVAEVPNGQRVFIQVIDAGANGELDCEADVLTLYRELLVDYAGTLGTPGSPATLAWIASDLGCNLIAWDENGSMYQDDGTATPATATNDPVHRWYPTVEVGVSGNYWRAPSAALRPLRSSRGGISHASGATRMSLGATGFGNTDFFAQAGEQFMLLLGTIGSNSNGTIFARRHSSGLADIQFYYDGDDFGGGFIRRFTRNWSPGVKGVNHSGQEGVAGAYWDGTNWSWVAGGIARPGLVSPGTGADLGQELTIGDQAQSAGYPWEGEFTRKVMTDAADYDRLRQLYAWTMGVTLNQTLDPTGAAPGLILDGADTATSGESGTLNLVASMNSVAAAVSGSNGEMILENSEILLDGADTATSGESGSLNLEVSMDSVTAAVSGDTGALNFEVSMDSVAAAVSGDTGELVLSGRDQLDGSGSATSGESGNLEVDIGLTASAAAESGEAGEMNMDMALGAGASAVSFQFGTLEGVTVEPANAARKWLKRRRRSA